MPKYQEILTNSNNYNYKENYIIAKNNNKFGIIALTKNKILIDFIYDNIYINKENQIIGIINNNENIIILKK